jgi:arylsulfatase A-like enzyme
MNERPHIVLFCTDTQRCDTLGCYGSQLNLTPHLDRLAADGIVCEQAYTASPVCGPARCSLITGLYPPSHGSIENGFARDADLITLPDVMAAAGYRCLMAGKTHFGPIPEAFEEVYEGPDIEAVGSYPAGDAAVVDRALQWLDDGADNDRPIFLFISLHMPHEPFQPTDEAIAAVDIDKMPPLNFEPGDLEKQPDYLRKDLGIPHFAEEIAREFYPDGQPDMEAIDRDRQRYYALMGMVDEQFGRVMQKLDDLSMAEDSVTVFTSDHGSTLYDRGFKDKHCFYDEVWRVPMIVHAPGRLSPRREAGPMTWLDLPTTFANWAGADGSAFQGFDLTAALDHESVDWPRVAVPASIWHTLALTTDRWTLEYDTLRGVGRLFDRHTDPLQRCDVWDEPDAQTIRGKLTEALLNWRASLHSPQQSAKRFEVGGPVADVAKATESRLPGNLADTHLQSAVRGCV